MKIDLVGFRKTLDAAFLARGASDRDAQRWVATDTMWHHHDAVLQALETARDVLLELEKGVALVMLALPHPRDARDIRGPSYCPHCGERLT